MDSLDSLASLLRDYMVLMQKKQTNKEAIKQIDITINEHFSHLFEDKLVVEVNELLKKLDLSCTAEKLYSSTPSQLKNEAWSIVLENLQLHLKKNNNAKLSIRSQSVRETQSTNNMQILSTGSHWIHKNCLPDTAIRFLEVSNSEETTPNKTVDELPCFNDEYNVLRPVPHYVPRPQDALGSIALFIRNGGPGGCIEAEAFAFMYNLPAKLWAWDNANNCCKFMFTLRQGDHSENYLSKPLNLLFISNRMAWGVCNADGTYPEKRQIYYGSDGIYQALHFAANESLRYKSVDVVPQTIKEIRDDVASRLDGAPAKRMALDVEYNAAKKVLQLLKLSDHVHVTRHDPQTASDYIMPQITPQMSPRMGLVHRGNLGWRIFTYLNNSIVADSQTIDSMLLPSKIKSHCSVTHALREFVCLLGRNDEEAMLAISEEVNMPLAPSIARELSEHYTDKVITQLKESYARFYSCADESVRRNLDAAGKLHSKKYPYKIFSSTSQEKTVKNYIKYLGKTKRFGAEISLAGLAETYNVLVRVWTSDNNYSIALEPTRVYGRKSRAVIDVYRVGAHYQYLDTQKLASIGIDNSAKEGRLELGQLAIFDESISHKSTIDQSLLQSKVAVDVGGDGNCQFLVIAYALDLGHFGQIYQQYKSGKDISLQVSAVFKDEPKLEKANSIDAINYFCERIAQTLRNELIENWIFRFKEADYTNGHEVHTLVEELVKAAHNEAGEIIGKISSSNSSHSWTVGIERQTLSTLRQRIAVIEEIMDFCPKSDDILYSQGLQVLRIFMDELKLKGRNSLF